MAFILILFTTNIHSACFISGCHDKHIIVKYYYWYNQHFFRKYCYL